MGVLNGIAGAVDGIQTVRTWSVQTGAETHALHASNTKRGPVRLEGNEDWSGSYSSYGHTPLALPGETFAFTGSFDGADGVVGSAVVDSAEITIDVEGKTPISHVVNFSGDGALAFGEAVAVDESDPDAFSPVGCKAALGTLIAEPVWTDLDNVRTMVISLSAANASYASSGSAGHMKRLVGNIDCTMSITVYEGDPTKVIAPNTHKAVRLYVTPTLYWEFLWAIFSEASGIEVDVEGGGMLGVTYNAGFNGWDTIAAALTEGHIKTPEAATWWPAA